MDEFSASGFVSDCPARLGVEIISDKWAVSVIWALSRRPRRHGELVGVIGGISRKVLTHTLRRLQDYGLVDRGVREAHIEYRLTGLGHTLVVPIRVLTEWSARHSEAITDFTEARRSAPGHDSLHLFS